MNGTTEAFGASSPRIKFLLSRDELLAGGGKAQLVLSIGVRGPDVIQFPYPAAL